MHRTILSADNIEAARAVARVRDFAALCSDPRHPTDRRWAYYHEMLDATRTYTREGGDPSLSGMVRDFADFMG